MGRIDYIDDPNAPQANSVVPSVTAVVQDERARILLIRKVDNDLWALPGGGHDIGESIRDTVVREVLEETGYRVEVLRLAGTYTNPRHVMAYDDGEVRQQFSLCFVCRLVGGEARTSNESKAVRWVDREDLTELSMHPSMRLRIDQALAGEREAFIG
ncbi:NUDIX domain-containing protein [Flexivirga alba]|uniref:NUDIX domain-containing protein n=1 Tax=Flexivirga alba TaxID=702742 RepID=A0ABW2AJT0_9MICO